MFNMIKFLKKYWVIIFLLFISFLLPFNVEAKELYNESVLEERLYEAELISGDDVFFKYAFGYVPVDDQNFFVTNEDKVIKFEYYIIDSIDSKGNIKYKKYDFSKADKSVWYPEGYIFRDYRGEMTEFPGENLVDNFYLCQKDNLYDKHNKSCRIVLPAINGKISRWKFGSFKYDDKKNTDLCEFSGSHYYVCNSEHSKYVGTYEFYSSYVYKFYEIPDEKPQLKVTCDNNKLAKGETTKCRVSFSYKYNVSAQFNILSNKLKISNFKVVDGYHCNVNEIDNGLLFGYFNDSNGYIKDKEIATFDVSSDSDVNNVLASLRRTNFRYIDRLGENTLSDASFDVDLENKKDNIENKDNIINPNTFRDNYYLVIGILIVGLICFIQMKSKAKSK